MTASVATSLSGIAADHWNSLCGGSPFLRHEWLSALHETGCACADTGWSPAYLLLHDAGKLAAAMPLYLKSHSYGEYVFDWAWADAYERHGLNYYPKLLSAIPFTPVSGLRLLGSAPGHGDELVAAALELARETKVSSLHCLFPPRHQTEVMVRHGMMLRQGVQFHWHNQNYADFDSFLEALNHDKRKKIRQERRKVRDAGITFEWLEGPAIAAADWAFFTRCYNKTYRAHRSSPYLNLDFFERIGRTMPDNLVMLVARRKGMPIAASFNVHDGITLWGRYWGALEHHPALHFEACYYQVIEYCISRGIQIFEGGAQGEHKMARGLMPVTTYSTHWLAHSRFANAVDDFLLRERKSIAGYINELEERAPYKSLGEVVGIGKIPGQTD